MNLYFALPEVFFMVYRQDNQILLPHWNVITAAHIGI